MTLDDLRTAHPSLAFAIYAMTPGEDVVLEVHAPDGNVFTFTAATEQAAIDLAFPPEPPANVFD